MPDFISLQCLFIFKENYKVLNRFKKQDIVNEINRNDSRFCTDKKRKNSYEKAVRHIYEIGRKMGLKGDYEEVKAVWNGSPWWMKPWLGLSVFLSFGSIASLSEIIIKWKGFILDAIEFYRNWISIPVSQFFEIFNLHLSGVNTDFLILGMLFIISAVRGMWVSTDYSDRASVFGSVIATIISIGGPAIYIFRFNGIKGSPPMYYWGLMIVLFIALPYIFNIKNKIIYFFPVGISVILILLLGAINSGLTAQI